MSARGGRLSRALERELSPVRSGVDEDVVSLSQLPFQERHRERVLEPRLDRALQRPRAVDRVPAAIGEKLLGLVGQLDRKTLARKDPGEAPRKGAEGRDIAFFHPLFTHEVLVEVCGRKTTATERPESSG